MLIVGLLMLFEIVRSAYSIPVDNGVEGDPLITCGGDHLAVLWKTRNPFEGHAFVRGHYGETGCRTAETTAGTKEVEIKLPFSSCGIRRSRSANPKGIFVTVTLVIAFHPRFITKVDRAYYVQCFYMEAEKVVTTELEVSMLTTSLQTQTVPMPVCRYEVLDGGQSGTAIRYAKIGDQVYHKWTCETEAADTFCMVVHTCTVDDGAGDHILLLDNNGCAQDKYLLGNLDYQSDLSAGKESHVFKYADRPTLYFNCQISIAIREPNTVCPRPQCSEPERGKRQALQASNELSIDNQTQSEIIDVDSEPITVLDLDPTSDTAAVLNKLLAGTAEKSDNDSERRDQNVCMSMAGFSGYAAINAALAVVSIGLFVAAYKRNRKFY